ncbi:MAG TPA: molybdopterin-dependent oxidoreductase [Anaerolineae bacterium]|nr:molybdopterin-dependent oxidoreductase [Anaerolineae bacterium]HQJ51971.1 molybdopterin-dependent oxidoreductase [Anaerolineae bacterium]
MMRRNVVIALLLVAVVLCSCAPKGSAAPTVDWKLDIKGDVGKPVSLTYADLAKMPQITLKDVMMQKAAGEPEPTTWTGVALSEILKQAEGDANPSSITAVAADGYAVAIPRDELEGAIVALKDGKDWIVKSDPDKGPIRLVCPKAPANRWLFSLTEVKVKK